MTNAETFTATLTAQFVELFKQPKYALAAAKFTPEQMAQTMTEGLKVRGADKSGEGVRMACRVLGLPNTYQAIEAYLAA